MIPKNSDLICQKLPIFLHNLPLSKNSAFSGECMCMSINTNVFCGFLITQFLSNPLKKIFRFKSEKTR